MVSCSITGSPRWLIVTWRRRQMPRSGLEAEARSSTMSVTTRSVSPGRTGRGNCVSPRPGEPRLQAFEHAELEPQLQGHAHRVQARRDQAAVLPLLRELGVDMERLRIPLAGELDDAGFGHGHAAADEALADLEILVVAIGHRTSSM